jgi:hypothetical protein
MQRICAMRRESKANLHGFATTLVAVILGCGMLSGCSRSPAAAASAVDPAAAAARALELYDANKDGGVDATEAAKSPPLLVVFKSFDVDGDAKLVEREIAEQVTLMSGAGNVLATLDCTVTMNGQPLAGAVVKLRPADIYGDALLPAEATTDEHGFARPTIASEHIPDNAAGVAIVLAGLYSVEITHPQTPVPAKYNTASELGCEVNPASRTGTAARFDLKSN